MYPKHLNQTNRTMNVTIEHVFCRYSDEAEEIYFRIMNTILFATDETELRASMERLKNETTLDDYFIFGYGAHHIWIKQRRPSDKNRIFKHRITKKVNVVRAGVPVSARLHRLKSKTDTRVRYPLLFPNRHSYRFLRKYPFIHFGCAISFYIERPLMQRRLLRFVSRQTSAIFPLPLLSLISLAG